MRTEHQKWFWRISSADRYEMKNETEVFMAYMADIFAEGDSQSMGFARIQFWARMWLEEHSPSNQSNATAPASTD